MKKIFVLLVSVILVAVLASCGNDPAEVEQHAEPDPSNCDPDIAAVALPADFSFYFSSGSNYYNTYDSATGKYVTDCASNGKGGTTSYIKLSEYEKKMIYSMLFGEMDLFSLPDDLTPYYQRSGSVMISTSDFYKLKVTADGQTKTIVFNDLYGNQRQSDEYAAEAEEFNTFVRRFDFELKLLLSENSGYSD